MKWESWTLLTPPELDKFISKCQILDINSPDAITTIIKLRTAAGKAFKVMKKDGAAYFARGEGIE